MTAKFVPASFAVPTQFEGDGFHLEPLGPEHNARDYAAWTSSIEHIHTTPGFEDSDWPTPMSLADNFSDLERHALDFQQRDGFTYSVLDGDEVIGCVYIYPARAEGRGATVKSWVRKSRSDMDVMVWQALSAWLTTDWPFENPGYASRD